MSIAVTTVILFVVFGVLLFLGVPISVSIVNCNCHVNAVMGSDNIHNHAENEFGC